MGAIPARPRDAPWAVPSTGAIVTADREPGIRQPFDALRGIERAIGRLGRSTARSGSAQLTAVDLVALTSARLAVI